MKELRPTDYFPPLSDQRAERIDSTIFKEITKRVVSQWGESKSRVDELRMHTPKQELQRLD